MRCFMRGRWRKFLTEQQQSDWKRYLRRAYNTPHCEQAVMRITLGDSKKWYLWLVYGFCEHGVPPPHMHLKAIFGPANEDSVLTTPEELEGQPFFEVSDG